MHDDDGADAVDNAGVNEKTSLPAVLNSFENKFSFICLKKTLKITNKKTTNYKNLWI